MALRTLKVCVKGATALAAKEATPSAGAAPSEPLCECHVDGQPEKKFRTTTATDQENPIWNFEVELPNIDVSKDQLVFYVFSGEDPADAANRIGEASLAAQDFFPDGYDGELPLPGAGAEGGLAHLAVSVRPEAAEGEDQAEAEGVPADAKAADCGDDAVASPGEDGELGERVTDEQVRAAMEAGVDKELEARVRTRAYFLWKNGSEQGAEADYFEALRTELSLEPPELAPVVHGLATAAAGGA